MAPVKSTREGVPAKRSKTTRHLPLDKRQFYHSQTGQPMTYEEVMSDRDSEDEVEDETAHLVDSQMLESMDEDEIMEKFIQLWNSFVKRQRVTADAHIPWACEAFSRLYVKELHENLSLDMCWRLFMIRHWDYGILDPDTITKCNTIIRDYPNISEITVSHPNDINNKNAKDMDVDNNDHCSKNNDDRETTQVFENAPVSTEATKHASGSESTMSRNGEKDEMDVEKALDTESSQVEDTTAYTQRSFGKRPIKLTFKMKEMKLASVGRRGRGRGREGRGGRGCGGQGGRGNLI